MEIKNNFINEKEINDYVMQYEFPNLNILHRQILLEYLIDIIDLICIKFNFNKENRELYEYQFRQNNYRDVKGILYMLLPFINESIKNKQNITSLEELYVSKIKNVDITKEEPHYIYSNLQYNRCIRDPITEINFSTEHLKHNFLLLRDTIQIISNKLYVNWINVRPLVYDQKFKKGILYKTTENALENNKLIYYDIVKNNKNGREYNGLYVGDIYNVIANNLYRHIKTIKWLLYKQNSGYIYLKVLMIVLPIKNIIINEKSWNQQNNEDRNEFIEKWKFLLSALDTNINIGIFNNDELRIFIKVMAAFFDTKYYNIKELKELGYKKIDINYDDLDEDKISGGTRWDNIIFESSKTIPAEYIYQYILECIIAFKKTMYGKNIIRISDDETINIGQLIRSKKGVFLDFKLIYNYAKSLTTYVVIENKKQILKEFPAIWNGLRNSDKDLILSRLNNTATNWWFNVSAYIRKTYKITDKDEIKQKNKVLENAIKTVLTEIIFDCLSMSGILSEFIPQKELTDLSLLPNDHKEKMQEFKERFDKYVFANNNWNEEYYYLTEKIYDKDYIEDLKKYNDMGDWCNTYAMDWISQINFFHRYLNNRLIYITGSTGTGKSTQIPKLLLYALKMIDYNYTGKIICSQPRIPPTIKNAETIGTQLGVPLSKNNYFVQYQYSGKKHTKNIEYLTLNIVTDGLLYQKILNNPLLKKNYNEYNENLYDIVIVDEAHEHNKNMDLILSIMKYAAYYNNQIKLIIVSATMADDEPIYRRFYRDINDNLLFPFNHLLEQYNLDRINIDRRLDISPPGGGTRFKIDDIYVSDNIADDIVLKIANSTKEGDILLFKPGKKEIDESLNYLNKKLPANFIALPFHSELSDKEKSMIEDLSDKTKYNITIPKSGENENVKKGQYNRVVIVATTLAEASLTINSLRYVVDTGTQKIAEYNYKIRDSQLKLTNISESSRIQRRGRVGRVAPGTVYYTYPKYSKLNIKKNMIFVYQILKKNYLDYLIINIMKQY